MFNTLSHPTHRRWAIFYGAAAALLAGWLFFEKMPDSREELAGSVENAFRWSGKAMERGNSEKWRAIQDEAADYPSQGSEEYKNRASKVLALAKSFENRREEEGIEKILCLLRDSLLVWADSNELYLTSLSVDTGLTNRGFKNFKILKVSQLAAQAQAMTASILNYCQSKVGINGFIICGAWHPSFLPSTTGLMPDEPFQAAIFLSPPKFTSRCATTTCFLNDQPLPLRDGIAPLRTTFPTPGPHTLRLRFRRERCRDGSVTEVSRDFTVNVLAKCEEKK